MHTVHLHTLRLRARTHNTLINLKNILKACESVWSSKSTLKTQWKLYKTFLMGLALHIRFHILRARDLMALFYVHRVERSSKNCWAAWITCYHRWHSHSQFPIGDSIHSLVWWLPCQERTPLALSYGSGCLAFQYKIVPRNLKDLTVLYGCLTVKNQWRNHLIF